MPPDKRTFRGRQNDVWPWLCPDGSGARRGVQDQAEAEGTFLIALLFCDAVGTKRPGAPLSLTAP